MAAILVIHPGALGDVLQAVPALRALRSRGSLTFSGQPRLGKLFRDLGLVDAALSFDGLGLEALFTPTPPPPSLVTRISSFHWVISWFGGRDDAYAEQLRAISSNCVIAPPQPGEASHETVWRHLLGTIDAAAPHDLAPIDVPRGLQEEGLRALTDLGVVSGRPLLVVHPGAGGRWKLWPVEYHASVISEVIRHAGTQVVIHQGPADHQSVEALSRVLDVDTVRLVEPELPLLAGVLHCASAYLGVDSGVSHLAAAVGASAVILFPAATRRRWDTWSPTAQGLTMSGDADLVGCVATVLIGRLRDVTRARIGRR